MFIRKKNNIYYSFILLILGLIHIDAFSQAREEKSIEKFRQEDEYRKLKRVTADEAEADLSKIIPLLSKSVADSAWPGGVILAAKNGNIFLHESFGNHTYAKKRPTYRSDIFDLASITKVVATTSAVMKLYEDGLIDLDKPVVSYLPKFGGRNSRIREGKSKVTIRNLLTHTSGLAPFKRYYKIPEDDFSRLDSVYNTELDFEPGIKMVYSDIGMISLAKVAEKVTGTTLDKYVRENIFLPLNMTDTDFNPPASKMHRVVPTEFSEEENRFIKGYVHDENAYSFGGVAGHAGLFSTAMDLARFSYMMLNKGRIEGGRLFEDSTVDLFTTRANVISGSSRCLGWDSPAGKASGGIYLSDSSFGHTGFTGTSVWIDPERQIFVILLTNAVHPDRKWKSPKYYDWRQRIHSAVYESLGFSKPNKKLILRDRWATQ